jgi:hypothetical protein
MYLYFTGITTGPDRVLITLVLAAVALSLGAGCLTADLQPANNIPQNANMSKVFMTFIIAHSLRLPPPSDLTPCLPLRYLHPHPHHTPAEVIQHGWP